MLTYLKEMLSTNSYKKIVCCFNQSINFVKLRSLRCRVFVYKLPCIISNLFDYPLILVLVKRSSYAGSCGIFLVESRMIMSPILMRSLLQIMFLSIWFCWAVKAYGLLSYTILGSNHSGYAFGLSDSLW